MVLKEIIGSFELFIKKQIQCLVLHNSLATFHQKTFNNVVNYNTSEQR